MLPAPYYTGLQSILKCTSKHWQYAENLTWTEVLSLDNHFPTYTDLREFVDELQDGIKNVLGVTTQDFSDPTETVFAHFGQCIKKQPRVRGA